jgi:hypothetical protein
MNRRNFFFYLGTPSMDIKRLYDRNSINNTIPSALCSGGVRKKRQDKKKEGIARFLSKLFR